MAEIAVVPKEFAGYVSPVPEGVDARLAAALPASAALTSYLPLKWGAKLEPGQSVLILGATGVSGKLAVRIAALLGAGKSGSCRGEIVHSGLITGGGSRRHH